MSLLATEMCSGLLSGMEAHQHKEAYICCHPPEPHITIIKKNSLQQNDSPFCLLTCCCLLWDSKFCWIPLTGLRITGREAKSRRQFSFRNLFQPVSIKAVRQKRRGAVAHEHILNTAFFETTYFAIIILALAPSHLTSSA